MKKSIMMIAITAMVGTGSVFGGGYVVKTEAASVSSLKGEQDKLKSQQSGVQSGINNAQGKINDITGQQSEVKTDVTRLNIAIVDTTDKISEKTTNMEATKAQITKLQGDVKVIQDRIQKRNELLKERARNYQETGGMVNYIDVLMGSKSFGDFIDRANAVATIMQADQEILKQSEADKQELEATQAKVETDLASLQTMLNDLEKMKQQLNSQKEEKDRLLASLVAQEQEVRTEMIGLQEQDDILAAQDAAIERAIQLEQEKQAAAAKAAAEATVKAPTGGGGSSVAAPPVSSGAFTRPASGRVTSEFGARPDFRPGEFHYGIDIANPADVVPIVAAADGVVVVSVNSDQGFGNHIILTSSVNGQIYTTVYGHMQTLLVGPGAVVSKGQQIGIMGSTGDSTGKHLHFEVHIGKWVRNTYNAVNPRSVVPF